MNEMERKQAIAAAIAAMNDEGLTQEDIEGLSDAQILAFIRHGRPLSRTNRLGPQGTNRLGPH